MFYCMFYFTCDCSLTELTLTLVVDIKLGGGRRRLADAVVSDTFDGVVVVPCRLDRLNT